MTIKRKPSLKYQIEFLFIKVLNYLIPRLKVPTRIKLARFLAGLSYHFVPIRKSLAKKNLKIAFPDLNSRKRKEILLKTYQHFAFILLDSFAIYSNLNGREFNRIINHDRNVIEDILNKGMGCILVTGHFGSWEGLGAWFALNGFKIAAILQKQKNPLAHQFFLQTRENIGFKMVLTSAPSPTFISLLKKGYILGIVSDQDARKKGVFVNFFARPSSTPKGTAVYCLRENIPVVFGTCTIDRYGNYQIHLKRLITDDLEGLSEENIRTLTQRYTTLLERAIRSRPHQYFWFHNRWKTTFNPGVK